MQTRCFVKKTAEGETIIPLADATAYFAPIDAMRLGHPHPQAGLVTLDGYRERTRAPGRIRLASQPWDVAAEGDPLKSLKALCAWLVVRHGVKQEHVEAMLADLTVELRDVVPSETA